MKALLVGGLMTQIAVVWVAQNQLQVVNAKVEQSVGVIPSLLPRMTHAQVSSAWIRVPSVSKGQVSVRVMMDWLDERMVHSIEWRAVGHSRQPHAERL